MGLEEEGYFFHSLHFPHSEKRMTSLNSAWYERGHDDAGMLMVKFGSNPPEETNLYVTLKDTMLKRQTN